MRRYRRVFVKVVSCSWKLNVVVFPDRFAIKGPSTKLIDDFVPFSSRPRWAIKCLGMGLGSSGYNGSTASRYPGPVGRLRVFGDKS